ncbi:uncharacterized protein LOC119070025 [Bradysia coprophila]|uniref:uncharacterized protein LOC119070025 n=1 Tax=Bradysia coprophila TaxID=38358 RepID=UPI00187D71C8|nr:uncharacterized protein LOC119070025 [Bradysia coprophila]
MTKCLTIIAVFVVQLTGYVFGSYYANNYPYIGIESTNAGGIGSQDIRGAADSNVYVKNLAHDHGNNLYSGQEGAKFFNKENLAKGHDVAHQKNGATVDDHRHVVGQNVETDKSHNRKHIKSGFHNTYSKDESGSNSSYYEDSDDRGGQVKYDKLHGTKGDVHDAKYHEQLRDGSMRDKYDDRFGGYSTRGGQDRHHLVEQDQGNRQGYRDHFNRGHGERYEVVNERPHGTNGYYHGGALNFQRPVDYPHPLEYGGYPSNVHSPRLSNNSPIPLPLPLNRGQDDGYFSRHRITIYDDPRELIDPRRIAERRGSFGNNNFASDGIYHSPRLEIRSSPLRVRDYYDERDNLRY